MIGQIEAMGAVINKPNRAKNLSSQYFKDQV